MYRLGSQGRLIQSQLQNGDSRSARPLQLQGTGMREAQRIPQQLDYLLAEIISPNEDTNVIGYLAYYYPKLKNEQNVALLTDFFLRCPTYFSHSNVVSLRNNYPVMEAFNYIMTTKFKISQPTVPFYRFYAALLASLLNCEKTDPSHHWKLIPILTGVLLSIKGREDVELYPDHSRSIKGNDTAVAQLLQRCLIRFYQSGEARNYDLNALVIISMSCALDYVEDDTIKKILYRFNYTRAIIDLIYYSPYGLNDSDIPLLSDTSVNQQSFDQLLNENPALKHLNRLSFLFERTLKLNDGSIQSNLNDIDISLNKMQSFSEKLSKKISILDDDSSNGVGQLLRQCLYASIIIHQAILTTFFQLDNADYTKYFLPSFSRKILSILFNLFFIVDRIGTSGFQPYNFVYLTCLQGIIQYDMKTAESLVKTFTTGINYSSLEKSEVSRAKLLFTLNLMEQVVNICSDDLRLELIVPLVENLVNNKNACVDIHNHVFKSIFESAHSVILKFFTVVDSSVKNVDYEKNVTLVSEKIIPYLTLVIDQFPEFLSINQLDIAIETISRTVFPDSPIYSYDKNISSMFLNVLFNRCLTVGHDALVELPSSEPIVATKSDDENMTLDAQDGGPKKLQSLNDLRSIRSALISALISVFPLIPVKDYTKWLSIAFYDLIVATPEKSERAFLQERLWDCVVGTNKYDPQKGNLGIMWWYENVNAQSTAKL